MGKAAALDRAYIRSGYKYPLGISKTDGFINFAFEAYHIEECRLILYNKKNGAPEYYIPLGTDYRDGNIFSVQIDAGIAEDMAYLYEINGRTILDPYAVAIVGRPKFGQKAARKIKALVSFEKFDWLDENRPSYSYEELILYKLHVRGFTKSPSSGVVNKGTFKGTAEKIPYLNKLGINAVILMPCNEFDEILEPDPRFDITGDDSTKDNIKVNYWGYGARNYYFAPKASYAADTDNALNEFKLMVKEFHRHGIEVFMEFCFTEEDSLFLIDSCLRYWVETCHVDGFRLMSVIPHAEILADDPYLKGTALIYFGWNLHNMKNVDNLAECNDNFLICARRFIKGDEEQIASFQNFIRPEPDKCATISYITDTNGFTLADLYSYDIKHNDANGEGNKDGTDYNYSWNCGFEGVTRKNAVKDLRIRMMKNLLSALFLSQGTPMLLAGDEFCNSQEGNNNAYCQDNQISWLDWNRKSQSEEIFEFVRMLIQLRKDSDVFGRRISATESFGIYNGCPNLSFHGTRAWYPDYSNYSRTFGILLAAQDIDKGQESYYYIVYNMHWEEHYFDLPITAKCAKWDTVFTTMKKKAGKSGKGKDEKSFLADQRSVTLLRIHE